MLLLSMMALSTAYAQSQPAGMRVEVAEAETDNGEYSIFTYKDTDEDDSFGYYLSLELMELRIQNLMLYACAIIELTK